jgi:hypothetical protein
MIDEALGELLEDMVAVCVGGPATNIFGLIGIFREVQTAENRSYRFDFESWIKLGMCSRKNGLGARGTYHQVEW